MRHAAPRAILLVVFIYQATAAVAQERIGAFSYATASDPITDEDASYIVTNAPNSTLTTEGRLIWRCDSDQMGLLLDADEFLNTAGRVDVIWRFDRDDPMLGQWNLSASGTALFAGDRDRFVFTFLALPAGTVAMRITDYRGVEYTYAFSLRGLTRAIGRLACARPVLASISAAREGNFTMLRPGDRVRLTACDATGALLNAAGEVPLWTRPQRTDLVAVASGSRRENCVGDVAIVRDVERHDGVDVLLIEVLPSVQNRRLSGWVDARFIGEVFLPGKCDSYLSGFPALIARCRQGS